MKNKKSFFGLALIVAVLVLGVGYAISTTELAITGTIGATPNDSSFQVYFDETESSIIPVVNSVNKTEEENTKVLASAGVTGPRAAKLEVSRLWAKGDSVSATYTILNDSADLSANLEVKLCSSVDCGGEGYPDELKIVGSNASDGYTSGEYTVKAVLENNSIGKESSTTVVVTATLNKTPIDSDIETTFYAVIVATPVNP